MKRVFIIMPRHNGRTVARRTFSEYCRNNEIERLEQMSRLTKRNENGVAYMAIADTLPKRQQEIEGSKPMLEALFAMFQKLAHYEDEEERRSKKASSRSIEDLKETLEAIKQGSHVHEGMIYKDRVVYLLQHCIEVAEELEARAKESEV